MTSREDLEKLYTRKEDPWDYANDPYELEKYGRTIAALPRERYESGLEIGCSEGIFTTMAAPRVERLLGVDVSATAVERARARCAHLPRLRFRQFDFIHEDLDERFDVIICSEVLYYIPPGKRLDVARKIASWLKPDGDLVLVHTWRIYTRDWDDIYGDGGAERLHQMFSHVLGMPMVVETATSDYQIKVLRATAPVYPAWRLRAETVRISLGTAQDRAYLTTRRKLGKYPGMRRAAALSRRLRGLKQEVYEQDG